MGTTAGKRKTEEEDAGGGGGAYLPLRAGLQTAAAKGTYNCETNSSSI